MAFCGVLRLVACSPRVARCEALGHFWKPTQPVVHDHVLGDNGPTLGSLNQDPICQGEQ